DSLTFSVTNLPSGATFDPVTGVLTWTPGIFDQGVHAGITISASDGNKTASETISITVANLNQAPVIVPMYPISAHEHDLVTFALAAGDVDLDPLVFSATTPMPAGALLDKATGVFHWTPTYDQAGDVSITFAATDPSSATATTTVRLHI